MLPYGEWGSDCLWEGLCFELHAVADGALCGQCDMQAKPFP